MRLFVPFALLAFSTACTEYSFSKEPADNNGVDDTEVVETTDVDDTDSDLPDETDDDPNDEEPPAATAFVYANTSDKLYEIDPATGKKTLVGQFHTANKNIGSFIDIAIDMNGTMFGGTFDALYKVDPTTAKVTYWCDPGVDMTALAFSDDGTLFSGGDDGVHEIDVNNNCKKTPISTLNGYDTSGDIVGLPDGYLYWTVLSGNANKDLLVRVDPTDGSTEEIGLVPASGLFGLGYFDDKLYAFSSDGEIVKVSPSNASGSVVNTDNFSWWGATTNPVVW